MPGDLCKHIGCLCVFVWLLVVVSSVEAQTATLTTRVSETVALSVASNSTDGDVRVDVMSSGSTVRMTLSGGGAGSAVVRVPLMVRSNTRFRISASVESESAQLAQLSVMNVRATGRLVSPEAIDNLQIPPELDLRGSAKEGANADSGVPNFSSPFVVLSGPRVSLGGTLNSPTNALQITLLIRIKPESVGSWLAQLTFFND